MAGDLQKPLKSATSAASSPGLVQALLKMCLLPDHLHMDEVRPPPPPPKHRRRHQNLKENDVFCGFFWMGFWFYCCGTSLGARFYTEELSVFSNCFSSASPTANTQNLATPHTNLATLLPNLATLHPNLATRFPNLATSHPKLCTGNQKIFQ
jgi:hypothetical protein